MKIVTKLSAVFFLFLVVVNVPLLALAQEESENLTIFSESNTAYPLTKIARLYSSEGNAVVSINFSSSSDLIQNIDAGEPADVFISSHPSWIETLKQKGLVDVYNLANIAKDRLVLVTSRNNNKINQNTFAKVDDINQILKSIDHKHIPLIIDSSDTSLGRYSSDILKKAHISSQKIYHRVNEDKKTIVDFINDNDQYCGIVTASAINDYDNIVVVKEILDSEIYYQALVIAGDNMEMARDFLKFLKSDAAKMILSKSGFILDE